MSTIRVSFLGEVVEMPDYEAEGFAEGLEAEGIEYEWEVLNPPEREGDSKIDWVTEYRR